MAIFCSTSEPSSLENWELGSKTCWYSYCLWDMSSLYFVTIYAHRHTDTLQNLLSFHVLSCCILVEVNEDIFALVITSS